jgi:hypothetical protein
MRGQKQGGGDQSANLQAANDIFVVNQVVNNGLTRTEARDICEALTRELMAELQAEARSVAIARTDEVVGDFIRKMQERGGNYNALRSPDTQYALLTVQREYARSGSQIHRELLTDLLVAKCQDRVGDFEDIVLTESIETVRKLTGRQVSALTVHWVIAETKNSSISDHDSLRTWTEVNIVPFLDSLPQSRAEYEHLVYCGCSSVGFSRPLAPTLKGCYPGIFQRGLHIGQIPAIFGASPYGLPLFRPCMNDHSKPEVAAIDEESARALAIAEGYDDKVGDYAALLTHNTLDDRAILALLSKIHPAWTTLAQNWEKTLLADISTTSVGTAIAHCNWARVTGQNEPLAIWMLSA